MDLYFSYLSTYSQKVLLGMYEKDVPFIPHQVDLNDEQARAEYRALYPFGKVPLLIRDDGRMIPESTIILEYVDMAFEQGPVLIPRDTELGRRTRFMDRMCDLYLNDPVVNLIFESWKPEADRDPQLISESSERIGTMYRFMDDHLAQHGYMSGDTFTLADCAAMPVLFYANSFAPFGGFDHIYRYWEEVSQRPSFVRLKREAEPHISALVG
jgi:glutathione S-transferase